MLVMLVRPRLRTRTARPDMAAEMHVAQTSGSTVFCFVGTDGVVASITPNARQVLGEACDRAADLNLTFCDLVQPDQRSALESWLNRAWTSEPPPPLLLATRGPYAERRWLQLQTAGAVEVAGAAAIMVEIREVTDQTEQQNHARMLAHALSAGTDAAWITDLDGRIEYVNTAFEQMFGYRLAEIAGRPASLLSSGRHRPDFFAAMWQMLAAGQPYNGEVLNRRVDGSLCTVDLTITRLPGDDVTEPRYVAIGRDITSRRRVEREVEDLAFHDALTGIANHRLLRERARQILALVRRHGSKAALLHIDLDQLGTINTQFGRAVGDDVLRTVAERLTHGLRESDTLARIGGDEFLVLLSDANDDQAIARVVQRLQQQVSQPFALHGRAVNLECRIGVALYPQDASSFDDLMGAAEAALRRAEQARSAFEFYEPAVSAASHDRLALEDDLHWAWEHDQFVLHYQPVISAEASAVRADAPARNEVVGVEALARWPHMERGMLQPSQFIPLAERTGRILSLDRWAIATAMRQAVQWLANGWDGWVSVNTSARSLQDAELPEYVERTLEAHGLDGSRLVLEITESAAMRDPTRTARVVDNLRRLGVRIALDDFGGDQSSLACLKLFPVDLLKLDRSSIRAIGSDAREEQLIEITISAAHRIGANVIAEGVEKAEQVEWLRRAGCDYVQGFLTGRPAPPESMTRPDSITAG